MRFRPDIPSVYLPNSGQIDLNAIGVEAGQANNSQTALNDAAVRGLIGKASGAQNAMNEYYGASSSVIDITAENCVASEWSNGSSSSLQSCGVDGDGAGWPDLLAYCGASPFYAYFTKVAGKTGDVLVSGRVYVATWTAEIKGSSGTKDCYFAIQQSANTTRGHIGWQKNPYYAKGRNTEKLWELGYMQPMPTAWTAKSGTKEFTCKATGPVGITIFSGNVGSLYVRRYSIVINEK